MTSRATAQPHLTLSGSEGDTVRGQHAATAADTMSPAAAGPKADYTSRAYALAKRRLITGTTDALMLETRGDLAEDPIIKPDLMRSRGHFPCVQLVAPGAA